MKTRNNNIIYDLNAIDWDNWELDKIDGVLKNTAKSKSPNSKSISLVEPVLPKKKEPDLQKIKYTCEPINKNLVPNQWVIEIKKEGYYDNNRFIEDFNTTQGLLFALYRLKEGGATTAMYSYLSKNAHQYNWILFKDDFKETTGYQNTAYSNSLDALIFYGILVPTSRLKKGTNGKIGKVFILDCSLKPENLPKEKYNPKNQEHIKMVENLKALKISRQSDLG